MKKSIIHVALLGILMFSITGCGKKVASEMNTIPNKEPLPETIEEVSDDLIVSEDEAIQEVIVENEETANQEIVAEETENNPENLYREMLQEAIGPSDGELLDFICDDFDLDGEYEAFGFTGISQEGDEYMPELHIGKIWFASKNGAEVICDDEKNFTNVFQLFDFGNRKYVGLSEWYVTARVTYLYTVKDGEAVEDNMSGVGDMAISESSEVSVLLSAYDSIYDPEMDGYIGHSWKPYYFYYDENTDAIVEYIGKEITEEDAVKICGENIIEEIEKEGYTIGKIYSRPNGILNINYISEAENGEINYHNANYDSKKESFIDAWGVGANTWKDSDFGGTYLAGLSCSPLE